LHWLQDQGLEGLERLPSQEQRMRPIFNESGVAYLLQPHEFQGLVVRGEFFQQKYGTNPLQELEDFINSKR